MIDFEKLLRLRLVVGRFGELDNSRWWNTKGQLGKLGASVLRRGFPRTYCFAQARSVFAVAAHRCDEVFNPPHCVTLWRLPDSVEEEFDRRWEHWLDCASDWVQFFQGIEVLGSTDLVEILHSLDLVTEADVDAFTGLHRSAEGRAVPLPGAYDGTDANLALLALGFACGEPGALAVPYLKRLGA